MSKTHSAKMAVVLREKTQLIDRVNDLEKQLAEMKVLKSDVDAKILKEQTSRQLMESQLQQANVELEQIKAC